VTWFLLILAAAAWWLISRYFWPFRPCPRCKGSGTNPGSNSKRHGPCGRCHGSRHVQRIGSKTVHRAVRAVIKYRRSSKENTP